MPDLKVKQRVKEGTLSPEEAIKLLESEGKEAIASNTYGWCRRRLNRKNVALVGKPVSK